MSAKNDWECRLLRRLVAGRDGAALFCYLFAAEWGYPPSEGTEAEVDLDPLSSGSVRCWFNPAACIEWEAAEASKRIVSKAWEQVAGLEHAERMN